MFIDAREIPDGETLAADLCVVGAGAAGIPLALQFAGTPTQVVLLETGALTDEADSQGIHRIESGRVPQLAFDGERRARLGGNTNFWSGNCRPLDAVDFERRDWIPYSGWPITRTQLAPFYEPAHGICGLGDYRYYDLEAIRPHLTNQPFCANPATLVTYVVHTCPVLSFGELHREALRDASNIRVCLNARATRLETDASGQKVGAVRIAVADGRRLRVIARTFVLAAGGVENPRLLLCSTDVRPNGLGNDRDLVGRFFMEHPWVDLPLGRRQGDQDPFFYFGRQQVGSTLVSGQLALSKAFMMRERVAGLSFWFKRAPLFPLSVSAAFNLAGMARGQVPRTEALTELRAALSDPGAVARHVWSNLRRRPPPAGPEDGYVLRVQVEQTPDPRNRVRLSAERDRFGEPRAELALRMAAGEPRRAARCLRVAADSIGLDGRRLARQLQLSLEGGRGQYFWHHMGTTRMHADPARGVVDADCRVHDVSNLFVAGSSVFPTGGTAAPTLTIVALALRLAQHLRQHHL